MRLDEVHVERRGVGEDFAASLHRTQDVGPHFCQLRNGRLNDLPGLSRRRLLAAFCTAAAAAAPRLTRCGGGHVGILSALAQLLASQRRQRRSCTRAPPPSPFFLSSFLQRIYFRVRLATNTPTYDSLATAFGFCQLFILVYVCDI